MPRLPPVAADPTNGRSTGEVDQPGCVLLQIGQPVARPELRQVVPAGVRRADGTQQLRTAAVLKLVLHGLCDKAASVLLEPGYTLEKLC